MKTAKEITRNRLTGTVETENGVWDYVLLPLTFQSFKEKGTMMIEFWKEDTKPYLTGIGANACPPVHSTFMFSKSIEHGA